MPMARDRHAVHPGLRKAIPQLPSFPPLGVQEVGGHRKGDNAQNWPPTPPPPPGRVVLHSSGARQKAAKSRGLVGQDSRAPWGWRPSELGCVWP